MRFKHIAMATLFLILGIGSQAMTQAQAVKDTRQKPGETGLKMVALPDLVVKEIVYEGDNKVRVRVMNQGKGRAEACYLSLSLLSGYGAGSTPVKTWTVQISALEPGKGYSTPISIAPRTWIDVAFKAKVDRNNKVRESDESNNELFNDDRVVK